MNSKQSCSDNLSGNLTRTKVWRRGLQAKYPDDSRNGKAATTLEKLAAETDDLSDEQWSELKPYFNWASGTWADAVSLASRRVEFQSNVRTFPAYINQLIGILSEQNAAN
jgi:hypothetical protein